MTDREDRALRMLSTALEMEEKGKKFYDKAAKTVKNKLSKEGVERRLEAMKQELLSLAPSPLERLLVDRIAVCWLQVQYSDMMYVQRLEQGMSLEQGEYYQRRQDRAHRRLLSAIRTLATVRKLAFPVLQMNIGDKQINVAHAGGARVPVPEEGGTASPDPPVSEATTDETGSRRDQKALPTGSKSPKKL